MRETLLFLIAKVIIRCTNHDLTFPIMRTSFPKMRKSYLMVIFFCDYNKYYNIQLVIDCHHFEILLDMVLTNFVKPLQSVTLCSIIRIENLQHK